MPLGALAATAQQGDTNSAAALKDCEQTDSAPLVVRACTAVLRGELAPQERIRILHLRARGWMKEDEFAAAAEDYTSILEGEPGNVAALEGRAKANAKQNHHIDSVADYTTLIGLDGQNAKYYRDRGTEHLGARHFDEALADFDKSIAMEPNAIDAYIGPAKVYSALGNIEQSKREFERGIAVYDRYLPLFWIRGEMAYEWGDKDLAIASYRRVLALNGVYEDARRRLQRLGIMHPP